MAKKKLFAYLAVQKAGDNATADFAFGEEKYIKAVLEGWRSDPPQKAPDTDETPTESEPDFTHESALTDALSRAVDFGLSQYELIMVASITPSLFEGIVARERVLRPTMSSADLVEEDERATLYRLTEDQYLDLVNRKNDLDLLRAGVAALPRATLMSIVATFDTIIVDIVSKMLRLGGTEWLQRSERTLSVSRLGSASTVDELVQDVISDEMYQFSRGSHDEQAKYIENTFGVSIKRYWKRWPDYIEVFERRNLIAHGETTFNKRYVSICKSAGHKGSGKLLGQPVELTPIYLTQACDVLLEFAILLPFSLWRKVAKKKERQAFANLNEAAFKLIGSRRYVAAERILEFALALEKVDVSQEIRQQLTVNRASALRHMGREKQAMEVLDEVDWSASADLFKLCVASVRGDGDEVAKLLPVVKGAGAITARTFKDWPCFSFVREDAKVRKAFQKQFGESLALPSTGAKAAAPAPKNSAGEKEKTVH